MSGSPSGPTYLSERVGAPPSSAGASRGNTNTSGRRAVAEAGRAVGGEFGGEIGVVAFVDEVGEGQLVDAGGAGGPSFLLHFGETVTRPVLLAAPLCRFLG